MVNKKAYFAGGGVAALTGAAFLIRDGKFPAENIYILEEENVVGGCLDGSGNPEAGFVSRGGRMFEKHYVCTFDIFSSIPSAENPGKTSVSEEIFKFNKEVVSDAKCRLLEKKMQKRDVASYGLNDIHLLEMALLIIHRKPLVNKKIKDWFSASFFKTNFWLLWTTSFSFQEWDNVDELRRYFLRFMHLLPGFERFLHILRTRYNQYDSMILPIRNWLESQGVNFMMDCQVKDLSFETVDGKKSITSITCGQDKKIEVANEDLVFVTLGSMVENSTRGSMQSAPPQPAKEPGGTWALWQKIARDNPEFGNPSAFISDTEKTKWVSYTVTQKTPELFNFMEKFTGNKAGTGGLVSFTDTNWFLSIVLFNQPFFTGQPYGKKEDNEYIFWGYGLNPDKKGNVVKKKMSECTGEEILRETLSYLMFEERDIQMFIENSNCIPTLMPYITSQFNVRKEGDRPPVVPENAGNFAFLGQFVEIPEDTVFTVEYSVRSAMMAAYSLLGIQKEIPEVYQGQDHIDVVYNAIKALMRK